MSTPHAAPALAPLGRRIGALFVDWFACLAISAAFFGPHPLANSRPPQFAPDSWITLGLFAAENILLVGTIGFTLGHRLFGLRVQRLDGALPGPLRAALRTILLCLVLPAVVWDRDGRGLHDKAAGTAIVRR